MLDRPDRREAELVGMDRPKLEHQQRNGGYTSRDVNALSEPVSPDRFRRLGQPRPWFVLGMAKKSGHKEHRNRDAKYAPNPCSHCRRSERAAELRPPARSLLNHGDQPPDVDRKLEPNPGP